MIRLAVVRVVLAGAISLSGLAPGNDHAGARGDQPGTEALPEPRAIPPEAVLPGPVLPPFPAYHRTSHYDIWQMVAVNRQGYFRPRVIYSPSGPYYLYNGHPYPWAPQHPLEFMPYIVD